MDYVNIIGYLVQERGRKAAQEYFQTFPLTSAFIFGNHFARMQPSATRKCKARPLMCWTADQVWHMRRNHIQTQKNGCEQYNMVIHARVYRTLQPVSPSSLSKIAPFSVILNFFNVIKPFRSLIYPSIQIKQPPEGGNTETSPEHFNRMPQSSQKLLDVQHVCLHQPLDHTPDILHPEIQSPRRTYAMNRGQPRRCITGLAEERPRLCSRYRLTGLTKYTEKSQAIPNLVMSRTRHCRLKKQQAILSTMTSTQVGLERHITNKLLLKGNYCTSNASSFTATKSQCKLCRLPAATAHYYPAPCVQQPQ